MRLCRRIHRTKLHSRCVLLTKYLSTEGGWSNVFKCCLGLRTRYLWWNGENTILTLYSRAPIIWTWKVQTVNNQDSSHAKKISIKWCLTQLSWSAFFSAFRQAPGGNAEIAIDFCRCRSRQQIKDCNLGKSVSTLAGKYGLRQVFDDGAKGSWRYCHLPHSFVRSNMWWAKMQRLQKISGDAACASGKDRDLCARDRYLNWLVNTDRGR